MGFLATLKKNHQLQMERNHNRPFLKGVMAACALIAIADREVSFGERVRIDQILETLDVLKIFDPHEGVDLFNDIIDDIRESPEKGRNRAYEALKAVAVDDETKKLILRICLAVSAADGNNQIVDEIEIVSLCSRLGIDPKDCGLYVDKSKEEFLRGKS